MVKMKAGQKVTGGSIATSDPAVYCEMANAGYDFTWTEMQHNPHTWADAVKMWSACPHAKAVPGARIPSANEFDEQHAVDGGALVVVVPTVRSLEEATLARNWAFWPPLGHRSQGGSTLEFWGAVPGGYRQTFNDNLVLILMIETLDGLQNVDKIARVPGVTAIFAASSDLGNFSGYRQGDPDYERAINMVHDAALRAHVRLCGPFAWVDRPDFTCFQNAGDAAAKARGKGSIARGAALELGALANTQGKVTAGPYAPGWVQPTSMPR